MATLLDLCKQYPSLIVDPNDKEKYGHLCAWVDSYTNMIGIYVDGVKTKLHRLIIAAPKELQVDHIDRNRFNNSKSNLRLADHSQQQFNTKIRSDNISGVKGVGFHKPSNLWRARLNLKGKEFVTFHSTFELAVEGRKKLEFMHIKEIHNEVTKY